MAVYRWPPCAASSPPPLALLVGLALAACAVSQTTPPAGRGPGGLLAWPDLLERPRPSPTATIRYGADPLQLVDLWLPDSPGSHNVVLMVHGGCWQTDIADRTIMNWIAEDLRRRGIAVWNIDYRGVDRPGGGYPGTFQDVAAAADALRAHAAEYRSRPLAPGRDRPQRRRPSCVMAGGPAAAAAGLAAPRRRPACDPRRRQPGRPARPRGGRAIGKRLRQRRDRPADRRPVRRHLRPPPRAARRPAGADQRPPGPDHSDRLCRRLCPRRCAPPATTSACG